MDRRGFLRSLLATAALTTGLARAALELVEDGIKYRFATEYGQGVVWDIDAKWPAAISQHPHSVAAQKELNRMYNDILDATAMTFRRDRQLDKSSYTADVYGPLFGRSQ